MIYFLRTKNMHLSTMSLLFCDPKIKDRMFGSDVKSRAQRVTRGAAKRCSLGEEGFLLPRAAQRGSLAFHFERLSSVENARQHPTQLA